MLAAPINVAKPNYALTGYTVEKAPCQDLSVNSLPGDLIIYQMLLSL